MKIKNNKVYQYLNASKYKKLISGLIQITFFLSLFWGVNWWMQKDMLTADEQSPVKEISLLSTQGTSEPYYLADGTNDTFIYFFAPWCSICHASIDNLEAIYQTGPKNINLLVIALDWGSLNEVDDFLSQHKLSMPVLLGTKKIRQQFKVSGFPSYYLISKNGKIIAKNMGYTTQLGMSWLINNKR